MSWPMRALLAAGLLFIGLDVAARWTGATSQIDLLKGNQIGAAVKGAQVAAAKGTVQGATP